MKLQTPMLRTLLGGLAALVTMTGCGTHGLLGASALSAAQLAAAAHKGGMTLFVMPDAGPAPILDAINGAKKTIQFELYMLTYSQVSKQVTDALVAAKARGVDVRVILEDHPYIPVEPGQDPTQTVNVNQAATQVLLAGGVRVARSSPQFVYTHEKSMVVDGTTAYIMTMNMTSSAFTKNREYVIADTQPTDVSGVSKIFNADWEQQPIVPTAADLVVSPSNSRAKILGLIDKAKTSLVVESEFMDDPEMVQHIGAAATQRHCSVNVMLSSQAASKNDDPNGAEAAAMQAVGIVNFSFVHTLTMHAKSVIVDNKEAYIGSENLTTNSLDKNREMGVIVTDPTCIAKLAQVSAADWAANPPAAPVAPASN